jgi:hypothetical protein
MSTTKLDQQLDDLCEAAVAAFILTGDRGYFIERTQKDFPELEADEVIELDIVRRKLTKPLPVPVNDASVALTPEWSLAGVVGYVTE